MEDRDNATTECYLKEDGTVVMGDTDGPLWTSANGRWFIQNDGFIMTITKKFGAGQDNSDVGEFEYEVERTYIGDMIEVGASVAITGVMKSEDVLSGKELEVGFFNMIDATDIRTNGRPDAQTETRTDPMPFVSPAVTGHDGIPSGMAVRSPSQSQQQPSYGYGQQQPQQQQQWYGQQQVSPPQQSADPYGYGSMGQQQQEQAQNDPYAAYYNQMNQQQQQQQQQPPQQQGYGGGYGQQQQQQQQQKPSLDPYGGFGQVQSPHPSSNFGGYNEYTSNDPQRTYGIYDSDDPGLGGVGQQQQQQQEQDDPYSSQYYNYGQQQQEESDPNPPPIQPYGNSGYDQNAWPGY
jgi:hypothetical protein